MNSIAVRYLAMTSEEPNITDLDIQAMVDGQLDWGEAQRVRNFIATNAVARQRYLALLQQNRMISEWWQRQRGH